MKQDDLKFTQDFFGYFNIEDAKGQLLYKNIDDTRVPSLSLKALNKLRKIKEVKKLELIKRQDLMNIMYGNPMPDQGGL